MDMTELQGYQRILQETGPAAGRVTGINHLVLFARDMDEGVRFYRDVVGLRIVRTIQFSTNPEALRAAARHSSGFAVSPEGSGSPGADSFVDMSVRQVFFEMGNGEMFSLYETERVSEHPTTSVSSVLWPAAEPGRTSLPVEPQKMDHVAFNVATPEDVRWFHEHLTSHGVAVSDVTERRGAAGEHRFITSIYFYDPSGNPLEIATFAPADAEWAGYDFSEWFLDEEPVSALLAEPGDDASVLTPRFFGKSQA
jgi:catechol 2,3-dioxygenase-like lactoylglutathione lyase family enzyme